MNKGTNSALMRQKNEKIILSLINNEPLSRAEIAKKTGLTKAAVTIITEDLINRGYITEKNVEVKSVGRNPVMLHINGDSVYVVGINITRTDVTVGITDISGKIVSEECFDIDVPGKTVCSIEKSVKKQLSLVDENKIYKYSVVTPGPVDTRRGIILNPPNFDEWHGFEIVKNIGGMTDKKVVFGNVSAATALAEKYFGAGTNCSDFIALLVDSGIGSGIVTNNCLFDGRSEFGHISINHTGKPCRCGNRGCLERYASIPELLEDTKYDSWKNVVDDNNYEIIKKEADYLGMAIISACNVFNIEKAVICGDITYKPETIVKLISDKISESVFTNIGFEVKSGVVNSKTLIASSLAVDSFFN